MCQRLTRPPLRPLRQASRQHAHEPPNSCSSRRLPRRQQRGRKRPPSAPPRLYTLVRHLTHPPQRRARRSAKRRMRLAPESPRAPPRPQHPRGPQTRRSRHQPRLRRWQLCQPGRACPFRLARSSPHPTTAPQDRPFLLHRPRAVCPSAAPNRRCADPVFTCADPPVARRSFRWRSLCARLCSRFHRPTRLARGMAVWQGLLVWASARPCPSAPRRRLPAAPRRSFSAR